MHSFAYGAGKGKGGEGAKSREPKNSRGGILSIREYSVVRKMVIGHYPGLSQFSPVDETHDPCEMP
jgi:hypothetical protein